LAAGIAGSIIGSAIEKEIQLFEWRRDAAGRWYAVDQQPSNSAAWGWQPT
jgi:hypothetical protein